MLSTLFISAQGKLRKPQSNVCQLRINWKKYLNAIMWLLHRFKTCIFLKEHYTVRSPNRDVVIRIYFQWYEGTRFYYHRCVTTALLIGLTIKCHRYLPEFLKVLFSPLGPKVRSWFRIRLDSCMNTNDKSRTWRMSTAH